MSRPPDITSGRSSNTPVVMPRASPVVAFPPPLPSVNNNEGISAASNNSIQTSSMNHQQVQQIQNQLENITVIVQSLNQSIESLTENFNRRLNQLDSRINSMAATASTCNAVSSHAGPSASSSPSHDVIRTLIAQQRQVSHTHPSRSLVSRYCNLTHSFDFSFFRIWLPKEVLFLCPSQMPYGQQQLPVKAMVKITSSLRKEMVLILQIVNLKCRSTCILSLLMCVDKLKTALIRN